MSLSHEIFGRWAGLTALVGVAATGAGCAVEEEVPSTSASPIIEGSDASAFPEAAMLDITLLDGTFYFCSGAIIAPRVVLTAGHCAIGAKEWWVATSGAIDKTAVGHRAITDYVAGDPGTVNLKSLDVGVVILDTPIDLAQYPRFAKKRPNLANGLAHVVGRIDNDEISWMHLFTRDVALHDGGFPYHFNSPLVVESGDSGGPVYMGSGTSRTIVAVNSGGGDQAWYARVDLFAKRIQKAIDDNP